MYQSKIQGNQTVYSDAVWKIELTGTVACAKQWCSIMSSAENSKGTFLAGVIYHSQTIKSEMSVNI